ncbi:MAG: hypothetical protein GY821_15710, partial [Gammaproteobacteria bacterium]|nr:hypothetical protein [Gammaproteobacteria bacterium]
MPCPCRSGQLYRQCCEPLIRGQQHAKTPLQLMRSRYIAYALENMDYIEATMRGKALEAVQKIADKLTGANRPRWYRLESMCSDPSIISILLFNHDCHILSFEVSRKSLANSPSHVASQPLTITK